MLEGQGWSKLKGTTCMWGGYIRCVERARIINQQDTFTAFFKHGSTDGVVRASCSLRVHRWIDLSVTESLLQLAESKCLAQGRLSERLDLFSQVKDGTTFLSQQIWR